MMTKQLRYNALESEQKQIDWGDRKVNVLKNPATGDQFYAVLSESELIMMRDDLISWARETKPV